MRVEPEKELKYTGWPLQTDFGHVEWMNTSNHELPISDVHFKIIASIA